MPLNFRKCARVRYFLFFIIIFADLIASFPMLAKLLSAKINALSVYIPTIPNTEPELKRR